MALGGKETEVDTATETTGFPDLAHHDCVIDAAIETFAATCSLELQPQGKDGVDGVTGDGVIVAVISLVGDIEWSVLLGLPRETATTAVRTFAGFELDFDSEDMGDAVGELANMLAGATKAKLDQRGIKVEISLPSVMRGEHVHVLSQSNVQSVLTCFGTAAGRLWTGVLWSTKSASAS
ncbi:hypothetical protein LCGC14_1446730 [marine sediment metagenome]|uniref:Chemotaxis phosphatase CheX-like domain-containing protein n=1 Tax=marine sediment metagenome TaxID=412755 RepID=A0A0F9MKY1_9ZZZZ